MNKTLLPILIVTLMVIPVLPLGIIVNAVYYTSNTIIIYENGTIYPSDAPITTSDGIHYILLDDIESDNSLNALKIYKSNIVLDGNGHTISSSSIAYTLYGVSVYDAENVTILNLSLIGFRVGLYFWNTSNLLLSDINLLNNTNVFISIRYYSHNITIRNVVGNGYASGYDSPAFKGIYVDRSELVNISNVVLKNAQYNIYLSSVNNTIIENTVIINTRSELTYTSDPLIDIIGCNNVSIKGVRMINISTNPMGIDVYGSNNISIINSNTTNMRIAGVYNGEVSNVTINGTSGTPRILDIINSHSLYISNSIITGTYNKTVNRPNEGVVISQSTDVVLSSNIIGSRPNFGVYIEYNNNNITLINNTFTNSSIAIFFPGNYALINNTVNGKPILYLDGISNALISGDYGEIILQGASNVTVTGLAITLNQTAGIIALNSFNIKLQNNILNNALYPIIISSISNSTITNNTISNASEAITVYNITDSTISYNAITGSDYGIVLGFESYNIMNDSKIVGNYISTEYEGILLAWTRDIIVSNNTLISKQSSTIFFYSSNNTIIAQNNITNSPVGVEIWYSDNITVYNNNFINITDSFFNGGYSNISWNASYPVGGNYWFNNTACTDNYSGPGQDEPGSDGICDSPFNIPGDGTDYYPLVNPVPVYSVGVPSTPPWINMYEANGTNIHLYSPEANMTVSINASRAINAKLYIYNTYSAPETPSSIIPVGLAVDLVINDTDSIIPPVKIVIGYSDAALSSKGISESSLTPYRYNSTSNRWEPFNNYTINTVANEITIYAAKKELTGVFILLGGGGPSPPSVGGTLETPNQNSNIISQYWLIPLTAATILAISAIAQIAKKNKNQK